MHDLEKPYLWSDDDLSEYLDDAQREAAERSVLLRDSRTPEVCQITVAANVAAYELDHRIIEVLRAKLDLQTRPLTLTTTEALDIDYPGWESKEADEPQMLAIDREGDAWTAMFVPPPSAADVLRLQVHRLPLEPTIKDDCEPEIHERLHIKLIDWMVHRAYLKDDGETLDTDKAEKAEKAFEMTFGPKRNIKDGAVHHDQQFPVVRSADIVGAL